MLQCYRKKLKKEKNTKDLILMDYSNVVQFCKIIVSLVPQMFSIFKNFLSIVVKHKINLKQ